MTEPVADRPDMPEGYLAGAPLPWRWAVDRLVDPQESTLFQATATRWRFPA